MGEGTLRLNPSHLLTGEEGKFTMAIYETIKKHDLLEPILKDLMKLTLVLNKDEKIERGPFVAPAFESPWIYAGNKNGRNCYLWRDIYLYKYHLVSRNCLNCWKVVVRVNHLSDIIKINRLQNEMHEEKPERYNGKCGIETRPWCTYKGRYAAFWYVPMNNIDPLFVGRKIAEEIDEKLKVLGITEKVILKRGCTELEERFGPSDKWTYLEVQHAFEDELDELFAIEPDSQIKQAEKIKTYVLSKWIDHAFKTGDPTVEGFVDSYPESFGIVPTVDYYKDNSMLIPKIPKMGRLPNVKSEGKVFAEESTSEQSTILKL